METSTCILDELKCAYVHERRKHAYRMNINVHMCMKDINMHIG